MGTQESQSLSSPITQIPSPSPNPTTALPILAIALLCILATALLLVIYYLLLTKFCLTLQQTDPISPSSPATWRNLGLSQALIRKIPTLHYTKTEGENRALFECAVCLSEFETREPVRVLPKCGHGFHLDCIDVWLQSHASCPICRGGTSGRREKLVAPAPSPNEEYAVEIELGGNNRRKCRHGSMMGDEGIEMRENVVRRSFSMDSVVREGERNRGEGSGSGRVRRSFFSFRQGRSSSVLPVEF